MSIQGRIFRRGLIWHLKSSSQSKHHPYQLQQKTLNFLLETALKTDFGAAHKFRKIRSSITPSLAFREQLPIRDYDQMHADWWHKQLDGGKNITWPGKTPYFALSSGTSGSPSKKIPVTEAMLRSMRRSFLFMFAHSTQWGLSPDFYSRQFMLMGSSTNFVKEGNALLGDISGINASRMPNWFNRFYKPSRAIIKMPKWEDRALAIAEQAPKWNLSIVAGIPSWVQMMMEKVIEYNKLDNLSQIWPNLKVYVSGGVAFEPYRQRFQELIGQPIIFLDTYNTSEGNFACQTRIDNEEMPLELILNNGIYYEFIPFNEANFENGRLRPEALALNISEVEEGQDYALVVSSCAGAWRYLMGDTVRFVNTERAEIKITGRIKHFLSICGEHVSIENMNQAIQKIEQQLGIHIQEFTVKAVKVEQHFEHHWFFGVKNNISNTTELAHLLDQALCELNDDYQTERKDNLLKKVLVKTMPVQAFWDWMETQKRIDGQTKFPRVLNDAQYQDWIKFLNNAGI